MKQETLKRYFDYDLETGVLYRKTGQVAGCADHGYIRIAFSGRKYYGHHLAWLWVHGYLPTYLDHKNGNGFDNRINNLREATHANNMANKDVNALGYEKHGNKYRARVKKDGIKIELGSFDSPEEARAAYLAGIDKHFGEFAVINRPE